MNQSTPGIFNTKDTNGLSWKANGWPGVPNDTAAPLLNVPSLKVTLRIGMWSGTNFCGVQVGRGVVVMAQKHVRVYLLNVMEN